MTAGITEGKHSTRGQREKMLDGQNKMAKCILSDRWLKVTSGEDFMKGHNCLYRCKSKEQGT